MPIFEPLALIGLGLFTGAYGVIIGAGGGFVLGPLLILVWGLEPAVAIGTSLAVVFITTISGTIGYAQAKAVDYRSGVLFALAAIPGSILGAVIASKAPEGILQLSFGILLALIAGYIVMRPRARIAAGGVTDSKPHRGTTTRTLVTASGQVFTYSFNERAAVAFNALFGLLSSLFGIGGGLMRVPMLVYVFRFPVRVATATSIFSMALYTGVGVISHGALGDVSLHTLLFAGIGVVGGAQIGVRVTPYLKQGLIIQLLASGLAITAVWLILKGLGVV